MISWGWDCSLDRPRPTTPGGPPVLVGGEPGNPNARFALLERLDGLPRRPRLYPQRARQLKSPRRRTRDRSHPKRKANDIRPLEKFRRSGGRDPRTTRRNRRLLLRPFDLPDDAGIFGLGSRRGCSAYFLTRSAKALDQVQANVNGTTEPVTARAAINYP
jgi:hypothetical protein